MGIHQDPQTSHSNAATGGSKADSLQHTIARGVEGNNSQSPNRGDIPNRKPGVYNQQKEICYEPSSNLRIPSGLHKCDRICEKAPFPHILHASK